MAFIHVLTLLNDCCHDLCNFAKSGTVLVLDLGRSEAVFLDLTVVPDFALDEGVDLAGTGIWLKNKHKRTLIIYQENYKDY
jgi:hypothetical protein